jgi:hypothetical protein
MSKGTVIDEPETQQQSNVTAATQNAQAIATQSTAGTATEVVEDQTSTQSQAFNPYAKRWVNVNVNDVQQGKNDPGPTGDKHAATYGLSNRPQPDSSGGITTDKWQDPEYRVVNLRKAMHSL